MHDAWVRFASGGLDVSRRITISLYPRTLGISKRECRHNVIIPHAKVLSFGQQSARKLPSFTNISVFILTKLYHFISVLHRINILLINSGITTRNISRCYRIRIRETIFEILVLNEPLLVEFSIVTIEHSHSLHNSYLV